MTQKIRSTPTLVTVCDLCNEEITDQQRGDGGELLHGHKRTPVTEKTGWARMYWPTSNWSRKRDWRETSKPENQPRQYDFHGECIVRLVQEAVARREESADGEHS